MEIRNSEVQEKLAKLAPLEDLPIHTGAAWTRMQARIASGHSSADRPRWIWAAAASTAAIALMMLFPAPRALAQRLLQWLTVSRIEVLQTSGGRLNRLEQALRSDSSMNGGVESARDLATAAQRAGFVAKLPSRAVLAGEPKLSTFGTFRIRQIVNAQGLEKLLREEGITDLPVPADWNNVEITANIGPAVVAEYQDISLVQCQPFQLSAPAGFPLAGLIERLGRVLGMDRTEARSFGERMAVNPALILGIDAEDQVKLRRVDLPSGPALLIDNLDDNGGTSRLELVWSTPTRIYALSGSVPESVLIATASSIQ